MYVHIYAPRIVRLDLIYRALRLGLFLGRRFLADNKIQIDISDNGCGIEKNELPYIFDRFYRGDSARNSAGGGSGIGLSIVKKIVQDHNGKVWADSVVGKGTTIHIVLDKYIRR